MPTRAWGRLLAAAGMMIATFSGAEAGAKFMPTGGQTTQPVGHYIFCQEYVQECKQRTPRQRPVELTRGLWEKIIEVNNLVNTMVRPKTDFEIWGVEEKWSYPTNGVGDCEDYALEKRRRLAALGIPMGNLLITVVRQPNGDGHAVLTVHTSLGDFVLDNLEARVLAWRDTGYTFLKRQSAQHAGIWVSVEDDRAIAVGSIKRN